MSQLLILFIKVGVGNGKAKGKLVYITLSRFRAHAGIFILGHARGRASGPAIDPEHGGPDRSRINLSKQASCRALPRISKRGYRYLRMLLTHGARSVLRTASVARLTGKQLDGLRQSSLDDKAACALAA